MRAPRGVRLRRAHVRTEQLGRQQQARPPLDLLPFERVDAVARPDPVGPFQDAQVHPAAAGGARLDLQTGVAGPQLVQQPVHGRGLRVHARLPGGAVPGLDQVPVVVPLQVGEGVLGDDRVQPLQDVGVRLRVPEVEHLLVPGLGGQPVARRQDPLGVAAGEIRVRVDHLRLNPQAELHAQVADVAGQRVEPVRPHPLVHVPVAEPGVVVPPPAEPAVVQHEPLGADPGRDVRQFLELVQVVVEVDGLPHVQRDRARRVRMALAGPQVAVEAARQLVETVPPVAAVHPRRGVRLAGAERDLAGQQQLAAAQQRLPGMGALGERTVIAAPRHVQAPDLAGAETEAALARDVHGGGVGAGAALAVLAQVRADGERVPLRGPFPQVAAGHVEQFRGPFRHRERQQDAGERERRGIGRGPAGDGGPLPDQAGVGELDLQAQFQLGGDVLGDDGHRAVRNGPGGGGEGRGEVGTRPVPGQARGAEPAGGVLGQQADRHHDIDVVGGHLRHRGQGEGRKCVLGQVAQVLSPVHGPGQSAPGAVQHQAGARGAEVEEGLVAHLRSPDRSCWDLRDICMFAGEPSQHQAREGLERWSRLSDSNRRPAVYKTAALAN